MWKCLRSGVKNAIFIRKSHQISLFATVSHRCKGEKSYAIMTHDCKGYFSLYSRKWWLQRGYFQGIFQYIYETELTSKNMYLPMNFADTSQFHFSIFIVNSKKPEFSLEYLLNKTDCHWLSQIVDRMALFCYWLLWQLHEKENENGTKT